jgi:hypothetical protein
MLVLVVVVGLGILYALNRVPANAAAKVNGEVITKDEINKRVAQVVAAYSAQGAVVEDADLLTELHDQALVTAITDTLLLQEADRMGIAATEDEVNKQLNQLFASSPEDTVSFEKTLKDQGLSISDIKDHISRQIIIDKLVASYTKLHNVSASESDMQELYKQMVKDGAATSTYQEMAADLYARVIKQKTDNLMIDYVDKLRSEANIKTY